MMTEVLNSEVLYGVDSVEQLLLGVKMQDSKYTGWQGSTVVMMLGDNGAEEAMFQGVGGIGWRLCGVLTVQDVNEEEE